MEILEIAPEHQPLQGTVKMVYKSKLCVATFFWLLKLSTLRDLNCLRRLVCHALWHILHLLNDIIALNDFPEDDVLAIQPRGDGRGNEKLEILLAYPRRSSDCLRT